MLQNVIRSRVLPSVGGMENVRNQNFVRPKLLSYLPCIYLPQPSSPLGVSASGQDKETQVLVGIQHDEVCTVPHINLVLFLSLFELQYVSSSESMFSLSCSSPCVVCPSLTQTNPTQPDETKEGCWLSPSPSLYLSLSPPPPHTLFATLHFQLWSTKNRQYGPSLHTHSFPPCQRGGRAAGHT